MKFIVLILTTLIVQFHCKSQIIWSDDFSNPSTWVIDNSGQFGLDYGWNINAESNGWYSTAGISSSSSGIYGLKFYGYLTYFLKLDLIDFKKIHFFKK